MITQSIKEFINDRLINPIIKEEKENIKFIDADITKPIATNAITIILHVVNDIGVMGAGVARALFMKWPNVRSDYIEWFNFQTINSLTGKIIRPFGIGKCQLIEANLPDIYVINMVGQNGIRRYSNMTPINYYAVDRCLQEVERLAVEMEKHFERKVEIHMPRIGCGLAGGNWNKIEPLVLKNIKHPVTVYDYE